MNAQLKPAESTAIAEYSPTQQALTELRQKYEGAVFDTSTGKGMESAKEARAELRGYRVALEKKRVEIKAPALDRCRLIDTEAKRITAELESLEDPIDAIIKAEERHKEREKAAREQAERERVEAINAKFATLRGLPLNANGKPIADIEALIEQAEAFNVAELPDDLKAAGVYEQRLAVTALRAALDARRAHDAEQADIAERLRKLEVLEREQREREAAEERQRQERAAAEAAEREAAQKAEDARRIAEREEADRLAAAARKQADDAARAERERLAAIAQAEAEERGRVIAEQARLRDEEQARLAAERKNLEREQAELAKQKVAKRIASTGLLEAAQAALVLMTDKGFGETIEAQTLGAAIAREPKGK